MTTMTLSEAMRLGASLHPQSHGFLFLLDSEGKRVASCALGAAYEAAGHPEFSVGCFEVPEAWRHEMHTTRACPACAHIEGHVIYLIAHLNDDHRWTREAIADWLDGREAVAVPVPVKRREAVTC